jgi:hypothetical protein
MAAMNDTSLPEDSLANASREEIHSALFLNLVMNQAGTAMMLLGKMPHPETGERMMDPETAKLLIDQLEMIESKTRGNLDAEEHKVLKQSLAALQMAFVEAIEGYSAAPAPIPPAPVSPAPAAGRPAPSTPAAPSTPTPVAPVVPASAPSSAKQDEDELRKKFVKKY